MNGWRSQARVLLRAALLVVLSAASVAPAVAQVSLLGVGTATPGEAGNSGTAGCPANLTPEELTYQAAGLLPGNYGCLKDLVTRSGPAAAQQVYRQGKKGPFYPMFGSPTAMLDYARKVSANRELLRFAREVKRGDVVIYDYKDPHHLPAITTRGPWGHCTMCVQDGPLPEFVSATGMEDSIVWRVMLDYEFERNTQIRILRPAGSFPQTGIPAAAEKAAQYAEAQLGKKYDFTYANPGGKTPDRFYCSNLPYLAYASPDGANMPFALNKSAYRDEYVVAMRSILASLRADDPAGIIDRAAAFTRVDAVSSAQLADFIVDDVLLHCGATSGGIQKPGDRAIVKRLIRMFLDDNFMPATRAQVEAYDAAERKGDFNGFTGAGRRVLAWGKISLAQEADEWSFVAEMGFSLVKLGPGLGGVIAQALPFTELLVALVCGENAGPTKAVRKVTDILAWLQDKESHIPLLPAPLIKITPRNQRQPAAGFVSPTDLAWSKAPKMDFNADASSKLDQVTAAAAH